jgi:hypothetical protein
MCNWQTSSKSQHLIFDFSLFTYPEVLTSSHYHLLQHVKVLPGWKEVSGVFHPGCQMYCSRPSDIGL